ncbi:MAG: acyl-CoA dehydrogenase [Frankiaceae bacterium]|nr:acyl-CoA dehydrogenase [Frankiaceae bacterium]
MTTDLDALEAGVADLLSDLCTPERLAAVEGDLDRQLWEALESAELTRVGVPEEAGGSGGSLAESAVVLRLAGERAASLPLAETSMIVGPVLAAAGLAVPDGPLTVGLGEVTAQRSAEGWRVRGLLRRVPYGGLADTVAGMATTADGRLIFRVPTSATKVVAGRNVAGEPRDDIAVDIDLPPTSVAAVPEDAEREIRLRGALSRAVLVAGAAQAALDLSVRYAQERMQFGRPIAAFQAVQQHIAGLAAEAAAARAAADAAVRVCGHGFGSAAAGLAVAAAKARTAQAAGTVAAIAHQVHGAIGMTQEHPLRFTTTRLWAWRSEWGGERQWTQHIANVAVSLDDQDLWPMLVGM